MNGNLYLQGVAVDSSILCLAAQESAGLDSLSGKKTIQCYANGSGELNLAPGSRQKKGVDAPFDPVRWLVTSPQS
jgi:hypothetical protein